MVKTPPRTGQKPPNLHSTPRRRSRIVGLYYGGKTARQVGEIEGVTARHVEGVVQRYPQQDGGVSQTGRGRHPLLDQRDKRHVLRYVHQDPFVSVLRLKIGCGIITSTTTLRRKLQDWGMMHRRALQRPFLTKTHAQKRLTWALKYKDHGLDFWRRVVFSDESSVARGCGQRLAWVFRPEG